MPSTTCWACSRGSAPPGGSNTGSILRGSVPEVADPDLDGVPGVLAELVRLLGGPLADLLGLLGRERAGLGRPPRRLLASPLGVAPRLALGLLTEIGQAGAGVAAPVAPLEERADHEQHDHAADDRHQPLPH